MNRNRTRNARMVVVVSLLSVVFGLSAFETSLKEGRRWHIQEVELCAPFFSPDIPILRDSIFYTVMNDTIVEGIECKNILREYKGVKDTLHAYDDNGLVYMYGYPIRNEFVKIWDMNYHCWASVTMDIMGIEREVHDNYAGDIIGDYWIEGIGSIEGQTMSRARRAYYEVWRTRVARVWDGETLIFDRYRFYADVAAIEAVKSDDNEEPEVYYTLQGVRVDHPQPGTIYVTSKGRKVVWK